MTKRMTHATLAVAIAAMAMLAGCGANARTPIGMCYTATGTFSIAQDAIGEVVTMPELDGTKAKALLKTISQKGTDAVHACREAAVASNADGVSFALGAIAGATQIGGDIAKDILTKNAQDAAPAGVKLSNIVTGEYRNLGLIEAPYYYDGAILREDFTQIAGKEDAPGQLKPDPTPNAATGKAVGKTATNADAEKATGKTAAPGQLKPDPTPNAATGKAVGTVTTTNADAGRAPARE